jgi:polyprenyl-phospho-N-acetylgalactosaminyl synthase
MKIICVIPAFNEEKTIAKVINDVRPYVAETIVVDDCSTDDTFKIAVREGAIAIRHIVNRGQGAALQTGNELALIRNADIIVHFDADDQFIAKEIPKLVKPLVEQKADIVFGSRFLAIKSDLPFFKENIIMPLARFISRTIFDVRLSDPQCGFRAISSFFAKKIKIENDKMAHCSEIISKTFKCGLRYKEEAVTVVYHRYGQGFFSGFNIIKDIFLTSLLK